MIIPPVSPPIRLRCSIGTALGRTPAKVRANVPSTIKVCAATATTSIKSDTRDTVPLPNFVLEDAGPYAIRDQGRNVDDKANININSDFPPHTYCGLDSPTNSDVPKLIPSCSIVSFDEDDNFVYPVLASSGSDSDSDSDLPELIARRDETSPDDQATNADVYRRGANRSINDGDIGMLLRIEELVASFCKNQEYGRQSASSKSDKKQAATSSGTAEKKSSNTSKFDSIRKKLEEKGKKKLEGNSATPQVSIDSTSAAIQDRADKVFTMGTECNAIIAWVAKHKNINTPAYTRPFYQRLKDDEPLRTNCKISLLALRRSPTSGSTFWSTSQWNRDQTREYTLNWQLYIRYLDSHEPNTSEFRMAWGKSLTEILNRFGAGYPIPQKNKYEADLGKGVFGDYCTYPITYKRIEDTYFPLRFSNEDIAEDTDLLNLYFGENEEDVERAREWYKTRCGLNTQVVQAQAAEVEDLSELAKNIF